MLTEHGRRHVLVDDSHQLALQARCNVADALAQQAMRQVLVLLTHRVRPIPFPTERKNRSQPAAARAVSSGLGPGDGCGNEGSK